jgi:hypothetical protein
MNDYIPPYLCAPNYVRPAFSPAPKGDPARLVKQDKKAAIATTDKREREKCHDRSGGRCEVMETIVPLFVFDAQTLEQKPVQIMAVRCKRRAAENHHLIGGTGRRNKGRSILAAHRIDTCLRCHGDITGNVLVPLDGTKQEDAATVVYERKKLQRKPAKDPR